MNAQGPEIIADFGDLNGEAPVWDEVSNCLYWTDCVGFRFNRFNAQSGKSEVLRSGIEVTGFALNEGGGFIIANTKGIWFWNGADTIDAIATQVDGALCQMNDAVADPSGRFLAGSCFYASAGNYELGCLFSVSTDGSPSILDDGFHLANGIGFSPDTKQLYFTDSAARTIYRYDYDLQTGNANNRSVLVRVPLDEGVPDGLAVDSHGFLWSAQWYGGCVVRYDPDGAVERRIATPAKQTSSVAFGGSEWDHLFITSAAQYFPSPLSPDNFDPRSGTMGGALYRLDVGIQGKPQFKARIKPVKQRYRSIQARL
ncbi:MAG: SMP-30/gluconolactonase/LRE family protein [Terriglobales bacterium]